MYSVSARLPIDHACDVEGPHPQAVLLAYFNRRVDAITRKRAIELIGDSGTNVDHLRKGKRRLRMEHVVAVTDKGTAAELFAALAGIAVELATSDAVVDALAAERARLKLEAAQEPEPPPSPDAKRKPPRRGRPRPERGRPDERG